MTNLAPGVSVSLKCLGNVPGPGFQGFLDGRTGDGSVGLAPSLNPPFTGTLWDVIDDGASNLILKCMGNVPGPAFRGFWMGEQATLRLAWHPAQRECSRGPTGRLSMTVPGE
jgi:hypothetical protein